MYFTYIVLMHGLFVNMQLQIFPCRKGYPQMDISRFAVIGHPIGHTMSPFIHARLFALSGLSPAYDVLDVPVLSAASGAARALELYITIPHKSAILPFLDAVDEKAALFGSVNTVKNESGRMTGYDGRRRLRKALRRCGLDFSGRLLILGRGGRRRAVAFEAVLSADAPQIDFACRAESMEKARARGRAFPRCAGGSGKRACSAFLHYAALESECCRYSLALNATSVGMYPNAGKSIVGESVLARCGAAFDAVYNPGETEFLRTAGRLGLKLSAAWACWCVRPWRRTKSGTARGLQTATSAADSRRRGRDKAAVRLNAGWRHQERKMRIGNG